MSSLSLYSPLPSVKLHCSSTPLIFFRTNTNTRRLCFLTNNSFSKNNNKNLIVRTSSSPNDAVDSSTPSGDTNASNFCIIEGPETVQDFVRRLRVQQRIKGMKVVNESLEDENEMPDIPSSIPFLPHVTPRTLKQLYLTSFSFISGIIVFGGLIAPILELKLGIGGTSYEDFIRNMNLPMQLSQVDPIVASFSGGAVGVITSLMLLEINNVEQQEKKRCKYCHGTGYLACARCSSSGLCLSIEPIVTNASDQPLRAPTTKRCTNCSGAGKVWNRPYSFYSNMFSVMCPTCLCTGMLMASEHDPRIEPFD
ncbi:hypothetical protein BUALT_Bualt11G0093100 [Buddleja alternifolia]|uniref:Uncharacterized protein n=1 Tax=Buddleja alternifolia TaxID=168488 RepID=A0AAV6WYH8_9LAMI|nr:hypothetical protein BUALT_Bualt11G0093100 [Buddleja alternifolia]